MIQATADWFWFWRDLLVSPSSAIHLPESSVPGFTFVCADTVFDAIERAKTYFSEEAPPPIVEHKIPQELKENVKT